MPQAHATPFLADFLQRHPGIWQGYQRAAIPVLHSGFASLDAVLPGGGWPVGALIEILVSQEGIGELSLSLPALRTVSDAGRNIVFVRPPHIPYAPALKLAQLSLKNIVWITADSDEDAHWAAEQVLRARAAGAVLLWSDVGQDRGLRRLQVAAESSRALTFLYRTPQVKAKASPAALRLALRAKPPNTLAIDILKVRGGYPACAYVPLHAHAAMDAG